LDGSFFSSFLCDRADPSLFLFPVAWRAFVLSPLFTWTGLFSFGWALPILFFCNIRCFNFFSWRSMEATCALFLHPLARRRSPFFPCQRIVHFLFPPADKDRRHCSTLANSLPFADRMTPSPPGSLKSPLFLMEEVSSSPPLSGEAPTLETSLALSPGRVGSLTNSFFLPCTWYSAAVSSWWEDDPDFQYPEFFFSLSLILFPSVPSRFLPLRDLVRSPLFPET